MTEAPQKTRRYVDFAHVPVGQWKIHDRLENWARSIRGGDKQSGKASPMFAFYRSTEANRVYGAESSIPVNQPDAVLIAKGIVALPDKHRRAVDWYYASRAKNPIAQARELGQTMEGLAQLVIDGRQMMLNRGV